MEWIKQLPTWVKGVIAFITAIIGFVILVRNNIELSITVSVVSILIASFITCVYLAFSRKPSEILEGRTTYRFPRYRRLALAGLLVIPLISATLVIVEQSRTIFINAFKDPLPIELVSEDFQKATLAFDLIIQNNSTTQQILSKIGVGSQTSDLFGCQSASFDRLISAEDYILRFHVAAAETIQNLEPPLTIPPNDAVRFTVSLLPYDKGACWLWSTEIVVFVETVKGVRVQTRSQMIDRNDMRALALIQYSLEELIDMARNSPDATSRAAAIRRLSGSEPLGSTGPATPVPNNFGENDKNTLNVLFLDALQDTSPSVRHAAVDALASLQNTDAVLRIILVMQEDETTSVRSAAARALGKLRDPRAVEPLGIALQNDPQLETEAAIAMGMIGDSKAIPYLVDRWNEQIVVDIELKIAYSLIQLQSPEAIPRLIGMLQSNKFHNSRVDLAREILNGDPAYAQPFIPILMDLLYSDPEFQVRERIAYFFRFVSYEEVVLALGQVAVTDSTTYVRIVAVDSLGQIGTSPAIEQLKIIAASQKGVVRQVAEDALEALGQ